MTILLLPYTLRVCFSKSIGVCFVIGKMFGGSVQCESPTWGTFSLNFYLFYVAFMEIIIVSGRDLAIITLPGNSGASACEQVNLTHSSQLFCSGLSFNCLRQMYLCCVCHKNPWNYPCKQCGHVYIS